jgi:glycerophosphoryl diester phosphodiesterase
MRLVTAGAVAVAAAVTIAGVEATAERKILVAHRGASAYAPEHTMAAYRLALQQGADYVEQDLGVTKDGVLVCLHDPTLERTTNVKDLFPDRARDEKGTRRWYVADFTLAEIRQLDAGAWFNARFAGERVPTFEEAVALVRGKAGIFPELKAPEVYRERGVDMAPVVVRALKAMGLDRKSADPATPVILQSFDAAALAAMAAALPSLDRTFLLDARGDDEWLTDEGLHKVSRFASGIGPSKLLVDRDPTLVPRARALGLTVIPYTFRSSAPGRFASVREEMSHFLTVVGVDGVFTDNPDQFPR